MPDPPAVGARAHPRRPPAYKSVSLRHSPPGSRQHRHIRDPHESTGPSSPTGAASDQANPSPAVLPKIPTKERSSGESSDTGKWFESRNSNAAQRNPTFDNNEPPFFLRNSSSSETPPETTDAQLGPRHHASTTMPYRPGALTHLSREGSSTEDFRSVIDDLTVANKRLKQKLKKYEKLYDAHHQDEKLFEVRFHGLPDHKKKELEETLRKFAADLDEGPGSEVPSSRFVPPGFEHRNSTALSRFAESGYASLSTSGQNSTSAPSAQDSGSRKLTRSAFNRQQRNVRTYLHDIPAGLLPNSSVHMSEKSKRKLVVRRLEQIFAGRQSVPGEHQHPMQQEQVAQSAAFADRQAREAIGGTVAKEGLREARIMAPQAEVTVMQNAPPSGNDSRPPRGSIASVEQNASGSPTQRPTRPLDLDPYRAQVPSENMDYIRHLGFTPPDMVSGDSPEDGHGWIYLNLLINMAQLHTINVTPDFVKEAIADYSSKLELSHDGRKVRWKGGHEVTRASSDSSSGRFSGNSSHGAVDGKSPNLVRGEVANSTGESVDPARQARRTARAAKEADQNKFAYKPLFYHKADSEDDEDFYNDVLSSANSLANAHTRGDSSGFTSSGMLSSSSRKRRDDGPMIFYNKAKFCTDLSGDRGVVPTADPETYSTVTTQPLGASPESPSLRSSGLWESKGPLEDRPMQLDPKEGQPSSSEEELQFFSEALRNDTTSEDSPETMDFEVSGLGGVQPDDNFAIRVRRQQRPAIAASTRARNPKSRHYSTKILEALGAHDSRQRGESSSVISEKIVSTSRKDLPSSELPPASFLPFDSTSSGDVDSDLESDISSGASEAGYGEQHRDRPSHPIESSPAYPLKYPVGSRSNHPDGTSNDSSDGESINFFGHPHGFVTLHADGRNFDPGLADRLAKEIPAGSSAATAGGGSGFNSPASRLAAGSIKQASLDSGDSVGSVSKASLKRSRTSDSIGTAVQQPGKAQKIDHGMSDDIVD